MDLLLQRRPWPLDGSCTASVAAGGLGLPGKPQCCRQRRAAQGSGLPLPGHSLRVCPCVFGGASFCMSSPGCGGQVQRCRWACCGSEPGGSGSSVISSQGLWEPVASLRTPWPLAATRAPVSLHRLRGLGGTSPLPCLEWDCEPLALPNPRAQRPVPHTENVCFPRWPFLGVVSVPVCRGLSRVLSLWRAVLRLSTWSGVRPSCGV